MKNSCRNPQEDLHLSFLRPVGGLSRVGEAQDGMKLHSQDEVEDEKWLLAEGAWHIVLLKAEIIIKNRSKLLTVRGLVLP